MHRQGIGKRYEFMIWARLLKEGFDVYPSLVDDKGIDGIVAFEGTYYEVQVKSARNWRDQRGIDLERLNKNLERIIVILNQTTDQIRYFTAADVLAEDSWAETVKWGALSQIPLSKELLDKYSDHGWDGLFCHMRTPHCVA